MQSPATAVTQIKTNSAKRVYSIVIRNSVKIRNNTYNKSHVNMTMNVLNGPLASSSGLGPDCALLRLPSDHCS